MVKRKRFKASVDRISSLSEDVLGLILSLLPFKEAAATSILCRRWKYLWTSRPTLYFDGTGFSHKMIVLDYERSKFVRWVNQVVAAGFSSASRTTLAEFGVYLHLTKYYTKSIDKWLRFAVSRRVEMLELVFTEKTSVRFDCTYDKCYVFPYKEGFFPDNFRFIKKLSTHYVNVSGEALEFFLGNCPLLEQLSVSASGDLEALRVSGTSPAFKRLEISCCFNLASVVVCESNLESFKYGGRRIDNFHLSNVPRLTEIWIGGWGLTSGCKHAVEMFSRVFPQIERLKVYFHFVKITCVKKTIKFFSSAKLPNVKELVVNIRGSCKGNVCLLSKLIKAAPNVHKFVLEAPGMKTMAENIFKHLTGKQAWRGAYCQQLKEVELVGYHCVRSQTVLLKHLLLNFVTIESILVDTRAFKCSMFDRVYQQQTKRNMLARVLYKAKVKKHQKRLPSRINMKIL